MLCIREEYLCNYVVFGAIKCRNLLESSIKRFIIVESLIN